MQQTTPEIAFVIDRLPRGKEGDYRGYLRVLSEFKNIQQNVEYFGAF
jgi:hypothetical protein